MQTTRKCIYNIFIDDKKFITTYNTLSNSKLLKGCIDSEINCPYICVNDHIIYIDRSSKYFAQILDILRGYVTQITDDIKREIDFYSIDLNNLNNQGQTNQQTRTCTNLRCCVKNKSRTTCNNIRCGLFEYVHDLATDIKNNVPDDVAPADDLKEMDDNDESYDSNVNSFLKDLGDIGIKLGQQSSVILSDVTTGILNDVIGDNCHITTDDILKGGEMLLNQLSTDANIMNALKELSMQRKREEDDDESLDSLEVNDDKQDATEETNDTDTKTNYVDIN